MSIEMLSLVWARSEHRGSNLLVLLAIADHADENGEAYPSVRLLSEKARISRRSVQYALQALYESGELELVKEGRWDRANVYRISADELRKKEGVQKLRPVLRVAP